LQGSDASSAKVLQSQNRQSAKIRIPVNGIRVVHGRQSKQEFSVMPPGTTRKRPSQPAKSCKYVNPLPAVETGTVPIRVGLHGKSASTSGFMRLE
jgi:hypothetical protein